MSQSDKKHSLTVQLHLGNAEANALLRLIDTHEGLALSDIVTRAIAWQDCCDTVARQGHEILCRTSDGEEVPLIKTAARPVKRPC